MPPLAPPFPLYFNRAQVWRLAAQLLLGLHACHYHHSPAAAGAAPGTVGERRVILQYDCTDVRPLTCSYVLARASAPLSISACSLLLLTIYLHASVDAYLYTLLFRVLLLIHFQRVTCLISVFLFCPPQPRLEARERAIGRRWEREAGRLRHVQKRVCGRGQVRDAQQ